MIANRTDIDIWPSWLVASRRPPLCRGATSRWHARDCLGSLWGASDPEFDQCCPTRNLALAMSAVVGLGGHRLGTAVPEPVVL